jgi:hypothetical protein
MKKTILIGAAVAAAAAGLFLVSRGRMGTAVMLVAPKG